MYDLVIVGAGASGLMAAISAKKHNNKAKICLLERMEKPGKKILATGNGRCNLSNINEVKYNTSGDCEKINEIKDQFGVAKTLDFFYQLGLFTRVDSEGRVYPYSMQAVSVVDVLLNNIKDVELKCSFEVIKIIKEDTYFVIYGSKEVVEAKKVILATGGKAYANLGSNGSGYEILKCLGHQITPLFTSLVKINTKQKPSKTLSGTRVNAKVKAIVENKNEVIKQKEQKGEVLFTDTGLSGIVIMQLSRLFSEYSKYSKKIVIDLFEDYSLEQVEQLVNHWYDLHYYDTLEVLLSGLVSKKIANQLLKDLDLQPLTMKVSSLSICDCYRIAKCLKEWVFDIETTFGFEQAQVTAGGVSLSEIDNKLHSKKVEGLYITGEVLDVDGDCGGYNLQWAWTTGYLAGKYSQEK